MNESGSSVSGGLSLDDPPRAELKFSGPRDNRARPEKTVIPIRSERQSGTAAVSDPT